MKNEFNKILLKNGIRLILVPDESKDVVTTMVVFGVGSRHESDDEAGISHVLEHMHYKGTKKRPNSRLIAEYIEEIGGEQNAFTSKEYTGYYVKVAAKHLDKTIEYLGDLLSNSLFDSNELTQEKQVILSELDMYEDLPMEVVENKFELTLYGQNSLGRDVIGYKKSIQAISADSLRKYRDKFYSTKNAVVVISGNLSALSVTEIERKIEQNFNLPKIETPKFGLVKPHGDKVVNVVTKKTEQSHLIIGFPGVSLTDPDRRTLALMALILGGSMSSRMFMEIREKRGLAYAVRTSANNYVDTGAIETYAGVDNSRVEESVKAIIKEYNKAREGFSLAELNRGKEYVCGRLLISLEDSSELANRFATEEILTSKITTPAEVIAQYRQVNLPDLKRVAEKYLLSEKMVVSYVGSELNEEEFKKII